MKHGVLALALLFALPASADKLWWSFPQDDDSAIEIDEADAHASSFEELPALERAARRCNVKKGATLLKKREAGDGTALREVRIDTWRCVMTLAGARKLLTARLIERLEDELDAHVRFLVPQKYPARQPVHPSPNPSDGGTP